MAKQNKSVDTPADVVKETVGVSPEGDALPENGMTMDDLTATEVFPEVQENAIAAVTQAKTEQVAEQIRDDVPTDAPVKFNKDGSIRKKGGRKKGGTNKTAGDFYKGEEKKPVDPLAPVKVSSLAAATTMSGVIERASVILISDEWTLNEAERAGNIKAWENTFDYYGGLNLSPPLALTLSHMEIIAHRSLNPNNKVTRAKLPLIGAWFKTKFAILRRKKNAQPDRRPDVVREVNVGKEESGVAEKTGAQDHRS